MLATSYAYQRLLLDDDGTVIADKAIVGERWSALAERTFTGLLSGATIVRLHDTPWAPGDIPTCLSEKGVTSGACDISLDEWSGLDRLLLDAERDAAERAGIADRAHFVDPTQLVCPDDPCQVVRSDGTVVYRDRHHLTQTFSTQLARPLAELLVPIIGSSPG